LLGIAQLVSWGVLYYAYVALAPSIASSVGVSRWTVACAFSASLAICGLLARVVGRKLDRVGARPVLLVGAILTPLALVALAVADSVWALWVAFVALGIAQALSLYESAFRAIVDWHPHEPARGRALLVVTSLGGFAALVFVPLTSSLVVTHGWRATTLTLAAVSALITIPIVRLMPSRTVVDHAIALTKRTIPWLASELPGTHRLSLAFSVHAFVSAAVSVALLWHLVESGETMLRAASLAGLVGAAQVPGRLLITVVRAHVPDAWRLPMNFMAQATGLLLVAVGPGAMLVPGVLLYGASSGAMTLDRADVVVKWYGPEHFSAASGFVAAMSLGGRAAAPFVVEVANLHWSYAEVLALTSLLLGVAAVMFVSADRARDTIQAHAP
jgi:MFS family permease